MDDPMARSLPRLLVLVLVIGALPWSEGCDRRPRQPQHQEPALVAVARAAPSPAPPDAGTAPTPAALAPPPPPPRASASHARKAMSAIADGDKTLSDFVKAEQGIRAVIDTHRRQLCGERLERKLAIWTSMIRADFDPATITCTSKGCHVSTFHHDPPGGGEDLLVIFVENKDGELVLAGVDDHFIEPADTTLQRMVAKGPGTCA